MTVLVTGATGFIGANLVRRLIKDNKTVHIIIKKESASWRLRYIRSKLTVHHTPLTNKTELEKTMKDISPSLIFHLAARGAYSSQTDLDKIVKTNYIGTLNLLQATKDISYHAFINTGTSSEYGWKDHPMKETDHLEPTSFYAATKAGATLLCQVFAQIHSKPILTLRPFSVYGPWEEPTRFIPTTIRCAVTGQKLKLTQGKVRRDFIYVEDVLDAYLASAKRAPDLSGEIINIGTGKQSTNDDIARLVFSILKKPVNIDKGAFPKRSWDTSNWVADQTKAKKILRWHAKYTVKQGLEKTIQWMKRNMDRNEISNLAYYQM